MIERWKNDDGSETILVTDDPPRKSLLSRILSFLGMALLVVLFSALPLLLIVLGVRGLITGEMPMASRLRDLPTLYGNAAIVAAWLHIAFGTGAIAGIFREHLKPIFKWLLWSATAVCIVASIYRLIRGS